MAKRKGNAGAGIVPQPAAQRALAERVGSIDVLRGFAILAMVAYHFAYDLRLFGLTQSDFENDPLWIAARTSIVGVFLLLVGISLVLADRAGVPGRRFVRRAAEIALCALLVSLVSYVAFPRTFIHFGILHAIALSLMIARPLAPKPVPALAAGALIIAAGLLFSHPLFDRRWTSWIGFTTVKPATQDFVPLFPWLGIVLLGIALGHALVARAFEPLRPLARAPRALHLLGRHSLLVYMIHQPILIGSLWLALALLRGRA